MKRTGISVIALLVVGVVSAIALALIFIFAIKSPDQQTSSFFVAGQLTGISENEMTLTQVRAAGAIDCIGECGEMKIKIGQGSALFGCEGMPGAMSTPQSCLDKFGMGAIPSGTDVCIHTIMRDGEMYIGKAFLYAPCAFQS